MKKLITHYSLLITSLALLFLFSGVLLWFNPAQGTTPCGAR